MNRSQAVGNRKTGSNYHEGKYRRFVPTVDHAVSHAALGKTMSFSPTYYAPSASSCCRTFRARPYIPTQSRYLDPQTPEASGKPQTRARCSTLFRLFHYYENTLKYPFFRPKTSYVCSHTCSIKPKIIHACLLSYDNTKFLKHQRQQQYKQINQLKIHFIIKEFIKFSSKTY